MINERDEMGEEERQAEAAYMRAHAEAVGNATKAASIGRTFMVISVQPNGDVCHVVHGEAYSDWLALEAVFKAQYTKVMRNFAKKSLDTVI